MKMIIFLFAFLFSNLTFADHEKLSCSDLFKEAIWDNIFYIKESVKNYLRNNNFSSEYFWR